MQKNIHIKFNYKKAVNNRYNYKIFTPNKSLKVLHIVSKEQLQYKNYYTSGCFNNVMQDLQEQEETLVMENKELQARIEAATSEETITKYALENGMIKG